MRSRCLKFHLVHPLIFLFIFSIPGSLFLIRCQDSNIKEFAVSRDCVRDFGTSCTQDRPIILGLQDGGFVIVWRQSDPFVGVTTFQVFGKIYNSDGSERTSAFQISTQGGREVQALTLALTQSGHILTAWVYMDRTISGGIPCLLYGRLYDIYGKSLSDDYQLTACLNDNLDISLTSLKDGRFTLVYEEKVYVSDVTLSSFTQVDSIQSASPPRSTFVSHRSTVALDSGGFVIFYADYPSIYGQFYDSSGTRVGGSLLISNLPNTNYAPQAAVLSDSNILVVWSSQPDGFLYSIYGAVISQSGTVYAPAFQIAKGYNTNIWFFPWILPFADGGFLVTWTRNEQNIDYCSGREYTKDYIAKDSYFTLNSNSIHDQASLAAFGNGGTYVAVSSSYNYEISTYFAIAWRPTTPIQSSGESSGETQIGIIVGVVSGVVCCLIVIAFLIGRWIYKKKRASNQQRVDIQKKDSPNLDQEQQSDQKANVQAPENQIEHISGKIDPPPNANISIIDPQKDIQLAPLEEYVGILPPLNNPNPINFIDPEMNEAQMRENNVNFAPVLDAQDTKDFIMDGRLAKPFMKTSLSNQGRATSRLKNHYNNGNIIALQESDKVIGEEIQYGVPLDPSTMKDFVLDGRLAKPIMHNIPQQEKLSIIHLNQSQIDVESERNNAVLKDAELIEGREEQVAPNNEASVLSLGACLELERQQKEQQDIQEEEKIEDDDAVLENRDESQEKDSEETKDKLCIVCQSQPSVMAFLDCMHVCTCQQCSVEILASTNKCPICRKDVKDIRKIYIV